MSNNAMPVGKIGNVTISRLIIGGNQFSGWSHSRDLKYLRDLFKAYATEKNILATLRMAEENGVNTIITSASGYLSKYWKDWGGQMQWIAQVHPKTDDVTTDIKRAIDAGAIGAYVQGGVGDSFVKGGRVDLLGKAVEFIKSQPRARRHRRPFHRSADGRGEGRHPAGLLYEDPAPRQILVRHAAGAAGGVQRR